MGSRIGARRRGDAGGDGDGMALNVEGVGRAGPLRRLGPTAGFSADGNAADRRLSGGRITVAATYELP